MFNRRNQLSEAQKIRQKQTQAFEATFPFARPDATKSTFDVPFQIQNSSYYLRIELGPLFPERAPVIRVLSQLQHPLIDPHTLQLQHERLNQWSVHSSLARIVEEILRVFAAQPPVPSHLSPALASEENLSRSASLVPQVLPPQPQALQIQPPQAAGHSLIPPPPHQFPQLDALSISQLEDLLAAASSEGEDMDTSEYRKLWRSLTFVLQVQQTVDTLENQITTLAASNLSQESDLLQHDSEVQQLQTSLQQHHQHLASLHQTHTQLAQRFSVSSLLAMLNDAIEQADNQSEEVRDCVTSELEEGKSDALKAFLASRKLYHARAAKRDRLTSQPVAVPSRS